MTKIIGLTGQTGAGKSTAAETALGYGCAVVDCDKVAREIAAPGSECLKRLAENFGNDIIDDEGQCRRRLLAQRAFSSAENTSLLNSITHPAIKKRVDEYISRYRSEGAGCVILDAPLLFECGYENMCDAVIAITAPLETRIERITARDGISREDALLRIGAQNDESFYTSRAGYIIDGSEDIVSVRKKTLGVLKRILSEKSGRLP